MDLFLVELKVADWPASVAWYRDRFGLAVERLDEPNRWALFAAGPGRVALKEGSPAPGGTKLVFHVADLAATLQRLSRMGLTPPGPVRTSTEGYRSIRFTDPDGHAIEMFEWAR